MGVGIMWWRGGFEDPGRGIKRVTVTLVRKGTKKKEKNITLLTYPRMRQWRRRDLRGLRGEARWRGGGLRTQHGGKRGGGGDFGGGGGVLGPQNWGKKRFLKIG